MMKSLKVLKYVLTLELIFICSTLVLSHAPLSGAYEQKDRQTLQFDERLANSESNIYAEPRKILFAQITTAAEDITYDPAVWIQNIYYYTVTRLGFADIPYNYIIDRNGVLYKTHSGWVGAVPELDKKEGVILVGYLSNNSEVTTNAQKTMKEFVTSMSKKYGISSDDVKTVDLKLIKAGSDEENKLSKVSYSEVNNIFSKNIADSIESSTYSTTKDTSSISLEVSDITYTKEVRANEKIEVSLAVKNTGSTPIFTDSEYLYISTLDGKNSDYAVNEEWDSFSRPTHIEGVFILPNSTHTMKFDMQATLIATDSASQRFKLVYGKDKTIDNTEFKIDFKITKGDFELVQIVTGGASSINVRACDAYECKIIGQLYDGQVLIFLEDSRGWYRVKYSGDEEGWIVGKYSKRL